MARTWALKEDSVNTTIIHWYSTDVAGSLVPQLNVPLDFETCGIHGRFHLVWIEREHSVFSPSPSYYPTIFFYKSSFVVETDLHALLHDLANGDKILCYCRNVQDILDAIVFSVFTEWNVADVSNGMYDVVSRLYVAGSIRRS